MEYVMITVLIPIALMCFLGLVTAKGCKDQIILGTGFVLCVMAIIDILLDLVK